MSLNLATYYNHLGEISKSAGSPAKPVGLLGWGPGIGILKKAAQGFCIAEAVKVRNTCYKLSGSDIISVESVMGTPPVSRCLSGRVTVLSTTLCSGFSTGTRAEALRWPCKDEWHMRQGKSMQMQFSGVSGLELRIWDALNALCFIKQQAGASRTI